MYSEEELKKIAEAKAKRAQEIADNNEAIRKAEAARAAKCVQKKDLVDGAYYSGSCRNASIARWFAAQNRFTYWRSKFGSRFLEDIFHPADDYGFDLFYPDKQVPEPDDTNDRIPRTEIEQRAIDRKKDV